MCLVNLFPFFLFGVVILEAECFLLLTDNSSIVICVQKIIFFTSPSCKVSSKADNFFFKDELLHNK